MRDDTRKKSQAEEPCGRQNALDCLLTEYPYLWLLRSGNMYLNCFAKEGEHAEDLSNAGGGDGELPPLGDGTAQRKDGSGVSGD